MLIDSVKKFGIHRVEKWVKHPLLKANFMIFISGFYSTKYVYDFGF